MDENVDNDGITKTIKSNKSIKFLGISIWRILAYFIIYSFLGFIVETLYGVATKGVIESRKSFLYGPFCGIYGIGAVILIVCLHKFSKKYNTLFVFGFIIGSVVEYMVSLLGELIFNVKWWDYSNMPLNINGRICVYFSIFWGFLSLYLICSLNPLVDKFIEWMKEKISIRNLKIIVTAMIIFLALDYGMTSVGIKLFLTRTKVEKNLNVPNKERVEEMYYKIYDNEKLVSFIYKYLGNEKMIHTFPNLKIKDADGNIIFIDSLYPDIQPYFLKVHEGKIISFPNILK